MKLEFDISKTWTLDSFWLCQIPLYQIPLYQFPISCYIKFHYILFRYTEIPAYSDTLGTWEKCHSNQIVAVTSVKLYILRVLLLSEYV